MFAMTMSLTCTTDRSEYDVDLQPQYHLQCSKRSVLGITEFNEINRSIDDALTHNQHIVDIVIEKQHIFY